MIKRPEIPAEPVDVFAPEYLPRRRCARYLPVARELLWVRLAPKPDVVVFGDVDLEPGCEPPQKGDLRLLVRPATLSVQEAEDVLPVDLEDDGLPAHPDSSVPGDSYLREAGLDLRDQPFALHRPRTCFQSDSSSSQERVLGPNAHLHQSGILVLQYFELGLLIVSAYPGRSSDWKGDF